MRGSLLLGEEVLIYRLKDVITFLDRRRVQLHKAAPTISEIQHIRTSFELLLLRRLNI